MTVRLANGNAVDRNDLPLTAYVEDDPLYVVTADLWVDELLPGSATQGRRRRVAATGDVVRTTDIDQWYAAVSPPEPQQPTPPPPPPPPPLDYVAATVVFHYTGTGWVLDADLTAGIPDRSVQLGAAGQDWPLTTGQAYTGVGTIGAGVGTPFNAPLRLTDLTTGLFSQQTVPFDPSLTGPYTLTIPGL